MSIKNRFSSHSNLEVPWISLSVSKFYSSLLIIVLGLIFYFPTSAQTPEVDSLKQLLSLTTDDSNRIYLMNRLSSKLSDNLPSQARVYAEQALQLSLSSGNKEQEINAIYNIGVLIYDSREKRDSALAYFIKSEQMAENHGFKELQSNLLMRLANCYRYHNVDSTKTVDHLLESVKVSKEVDYHFGTARSYAKLASFYTRYKQVELCEKYLRSSADYYLKIKDGRVEIAHYYDEVGNKIWEYYPKKAMDLFFQGLKYADTYPNLKVSLAKAYITIDEPEMALKYLNEALAQLKTTQYPRVTGIAKAKLAEVYIRLKDYNAALMACNEGIELLKPVSVTNQTALPALYRTKGTLMEMENNDIEAVAHYEKSIQEGYKINELFDVYKSSIFLGNFYLSIDPIKGREYCEFALKNARKNNFTSLEISACDCLYNLYKKEQSYATSIDYLEKRNQLNDSISTLKVEHSLDINGQIAQKDKQIAQESYLKELKEEQLKNQTRISQILYFASGVGLLLIGILLSFIKKIRKQNEEITAKTTELIHANNELARSNEELERFAHVASHDLKSPLKTIVSFAGLLRLKLKDKIGDDSKKYISFIESSGARMKTLIDDIMEYSKLSSGNDQEAEVISLNTIVEEISLLLNNKYRGKVVKIEASSLPNVKWNHSKLFLLFNNFIENGLKYNDSETPSVKLRFTKSEGKNVIHIEDNGIGIEQEYFEEIFVMFNRLHGLDKYEGTGLGLATCKKIVDEFKGEIEVSSQIHQGTIFKIMIPDSLLSQSTVTSKKSELASVKQ